MAIVSSKNLFYIGMVCFVSGLLIPRVLLAADIIWSHDQYDSKIPKDSLPPPTFNPWTGERSGPQATTTDGQFHYGDEKTVTPPPSLEDLYPKPGSPVRQQRPWGEVPSQFKDLDDDRSSVLDDRESRGYVPRQTQQWPDREAESSRWYGDERGGRRSYGQDQEFPDRELERRGGYESPQFRGYGDRFGYPNDPLFNDLGYGNGGWQGYNPYGGGSRLYRDFNYLP
jgi:hypothetical protein